MMKTLQKRWIPILTTSLVLSIALKYFWSFFAFPGVPFGYDAGIYRYLFLRHAEAFPPFAVTSLPPWAASHPLGLFFFSTILLKLGVPVDALIGWVWNLFPVILSVVLAWVIGRRQGSRVGYFVLLVALLSTVQYQGFLMIYWKVFVAFLWCVLAFDAFERRSKLWMFFGMMAIATHQQIGLIFALATLAFVLTSSRGNAGRLGLIGQWALTPMLGLLWYIQNGSSAIVSLLPMLQASLFSPVTFGVIVLLIGIVAVVLLFPRHRHSIFLIACGLIGCVLLLIPLTGIAPAFLGSLLHRADAVPGAFLTIPEYAELSLPLLLLGIYGFLRSFEREKGSVWQWAVLICGLAVISLFFFYRRFILPLDFFLLPFAASALEQMWSARSRGLPVLGVALVLVQGYLLIGQIHTLDPHVDSAMLKEFASLQSVVEPQSQVIVLDVMAPWVVGYLPQNAVSGPGIFDSQPQGAWEKFLYGTDADRSAFISHYPKGTYFFATTVFRSYYPPEVQTLLLHSCLKETTIHGLLRSVCGDPAMATP